LSAVRKELCGSGASEMRRPASVCGQIVITGKLERNVRKSAITQTAKAAMRKPRAIDPAPPTASWRDAPDLTAEVAAPATDDAAPATEATTPLARLVTPAVPAAVVVPAAAAAVVLPLAAPAPAATVAAALVWPPPTVATAEERQALDVPAATVTCWAKLMAPVESLIWREMEVPDGTLTSQVREVAEVEAKLTSGVPVGCPPGKTEMKYGATPALNVSWVGSHSTTEVGVLMMGAAAATAPTRARNETVRVEKTMLCGRAVGWAVIWATCARVRGRV